MVKSIILSWSTQTCLEIARFSFYVAKKHGRPQMWSQHFDSIKWPTVLVRVLVKGKSCNFDWHLCGSLYSTFKIYFQPRAFHNKRFQTVFKDQLVRSKATCSFNVVLSAFRISLQNDQVKCFRWTSGTLPRQPLYTSTCIVYSLWHSSSGVVSIKRGLM